MRLQPCLTTSRSGCHAPAATMAVSKHSVKEAPDARDHPAGGQASGYQAAGGSPRDEPGRHRSGRPRREVQRAHAEEDRHARHRPVQGRSLEGRPEQDRSLEGELPKQISDRLPRRRRPNPLLPIAGIVALGAMIAGIWWLFTSSSTGPRVRSVVNDLKQRVTGESDDLVRYDNDSNLGSLLTDAGDGRAAMGSEPYSSTDTLSDLNNGVPAGQTAY